MSNVPRAAITDRAHAREVEGWLKRNPDHPDHQAVMYEWLAFGWRARNPEPLSDHMTLEVAAAVHRGEPMEPGTPVPGCACSDCTGVDLEVQHRDHGGDRPITTYSDPLPVERARSVPVTEVAARLGIEVNGRGWAVCPFHHDTDPSLHLNESKGAAFCNPCGASWDGIGLVMELENLEFYQAVKAIAGWAGWIERRKAS